MNSTNHARSIRPSSKGWSEITRFTAPVHRPRTTMTFQVVSGAGTQAMFLEQCLRSYVLPERDLAKELGWAPPPAARIAVALQNVRDADWSLESDELKF